MENIIYNELRCRGYLVDVGAVKTLVTDKEGKRKRATLEIDFIVNSGAKRLYIQSAHSLEDAKKAKKEKRSLELVGDSFRKLIVVGEDIHRKIDEDGIVTMGLFDFLLDKNSVETLM